MIATGLPFQTLSPYGGETQWMAFFKMPGTE
jgi:hypothetical protein